MKFGISMFPTDESAGVIDIAKQVEQRGFDSFWVSEHSHMPLSTEFPLAETVPREYASMLDPFVAMTAAAAVTERITIGSAIIILPQHDPINCAKALASIDHLSGGRCSVGIGAGWNAPEMENHGTDPKTRFKLMRERVEAMRELWSQEEAEYHGELVNFDPVWQWPKPIQKPSLPVLIAGAHPNVIKRVARYGDGWLPVVIPEATDFSANRMTTIAELTTMVPQMNEMAAAAGRAKPSVVVSGLGPDAASVDAMEALGVETMILRLPSEGLDVCNGLMDEYGVAIEKLG